MSHSETQIRGFRGPPTDDKMEHKMVHMPEVGRLESRINP